MAAHFGFKGDMINEAVQLYRDYYAPHGVHEYTKYPGIDDLLTNLRHSGLTLHIATSKPAKFADQIIDETGWRTLFSTVGGASLDGSRRHKKDVITWVLGQLPASNHTLVYVGDRPEDAIAAQATGLQFIGVNWGFSSTADLLSAGAKRIATSAELVAQMIFDTDFA
jgi:phosphoglycolate phosphatase